MIIERFFGKGRAAQPKPRGKDEPRTSRPPSTSTPVDADASLPRAAAANPTARAGDAVETKTATTTRIEVLPGLLPPPSPTYEEIAARASALAIPRTTAGT